MTDPNRQKILDTIDRSRDKAIVPAEHDPIPSVTGDEAAIQRFFRITCEDRS